MCKYEDRFWSRVAKGGEDECWVWTAAKASKGYGHMWWRYGRLEYAHRISYEISTGERLPRGHRVHICHTCDNPACVNPGHIYRGTPSTNARDRVERHPTWVESCRENLRKARAARTTWPEWTGAHRESHARALAAKSKLSALQSRICRRAKWHGGKAFLVRMWGVSRSTVDRHADGIRLGRPTG